MGLNFVKITLKGLLRISCGMQLQAPRLSLRFLCCPYAPEGLIVHPAFWQHEGLCKHPLKRESFTRYCHLGLFSSVRGKDKYSYLIHSRACCKCIFSNQPALLIKAMKHKWLHGIIFRIAAFLSPESGHRNLDTLIRDAVPTLGCLQLLYIIEEIFIIQNMVKLK